MSIETSRQRVNAFLNTNLATCDTLVNETDLSKNQQQSVSVLLRGSTFRLKLAYPFVGEGPKSWASKALSREVDTIERSHVLDFTREFANLQSGAVREVLNHLGLRTGVSLPATHPYGLFPLRGKSGDAECHYVLSWKLELFGETLYCLSQYHVEKQHRSLFTDGKLLDTLRSQEKAERGSIEFL